MKGLRRVKIRPATNVNLSTNIILAEEKLAKNAQTWPKMPNFCIKTSKISTRVRKNT